MRAKKSLVDLQRRRETVARLIEQLKEELSYIDNKLGLTSGPIRVRMDKKFFARELRPVLEGHMQQGLSTAEIFEKITKSGLSIYERQLRVFLSRCKKDGLLELNRTKQPARWKLVSI